MSSEPDFTVRDEAHLMSEETLAKLAALPPSPYASIFTTATTDAGGPLTEAGMLAAMEAVAAAPQPHHHIIPASAEPGSLAICSTCHTAVRVPDVWP